MTEPNESVVAVFGKVATVIGLWLGGLKLADVQIVVAILSGLCVGGYALLQMVALWRREFRKKE